MHANFAAVQIMKLDRQSHQLLWQTVAKNFSHIRFCRPNAKWLSLLDDFVTTNFGTCAPRARAPLPRSKILATPLVGASGSGEYRFVSRRYSNVETISMMM